MKKINLNDIVKVKLTDYGKYVFYHRYDVTNTYYGREVIHPHYPVEDPNGFVEFQLHDLMNLYGHYLVDGVPNLVIENNSVYICEEYLEDCDEPKNKDEENETEAGVV
jgi:hypothetical protein